MPGQSSPQPAHCPPAHPNRPPTQVGEDDGQRLPHIVNAGQPRGGGGGASHFWSCLLLLLLLLGRERQLSTLQRGQRLWQQAAVFVHGGAAQQGGHALGCGGRRRQGRSKGRQRLRWWW